MVTYGLGGRFTTVVVGSYLIGSLIVWVYCRRVVIYPVSVSPWVLRSDGSLPWKG